MAKGKLFDGQHFNPAKVLHTVHDVHKHLFLCSPQQEVTTPRSRLQPITAVLLFETPPKDHPTPAQPVDKISSPLFLEPALSPHPDYRSRAAPPQTQRPANSSTHRPNSLP